MSPRPFGRREPGPSVSPDPGPTDSSDVLKTEAPPGLRFANDTHRLAYEQISQWIRELFGESASVSAEHPMFEVPLPDANVGVGVQPSGGDNACVDVWTRPFGDKQVSGEGPLRALLEANVMYLFGDLSLQSDGTVLFERYEPMRTLTKDWLSALLSLMASGSAEISRNLQDQLTT